MTIAIDRATIELGTKQPERMVVTTDNGGRLDPTSCRLLGDTAELIDASSFTAGLAAHELVIVFDLRRHDDLPAPGKYPMVLSVPDPSSPDPVQMIPLEIVVLDDRSCLALAGVQPTVTVDSTGAVTLRVQFYNRCGISISVDLRFVCDGDTLGMEPSISIGAKSTVDVEVGVPLGDALEGFRRGRLPDDLQVVVSKSGDSHAIELTLTARDLILKQQVTDPDWDEPEAHHESEILDPRRGRSTTLLPPPAAAPPPPPPAAPPPLPAPAPPPGHVAKAKAAGGRRSSIAGRVVVWLLACVVLVAGLAVLDELIKRAGDDEAVGDDGGSAQVEGPTAEETAEAGGQEESQQQDEGAEPAREESGRPQEPTESEQQDEGAEPAREESGQQGSGQQESGQQDDPVEVEDDGDPTIVGSYVGLTLADAERMISADRLTPVSEIVTTNDPTQNGLVVDQSPAAGVALEEGSNVSLAVGFFDEAVIPDVTGMESWRATDLLNDLQRAAGESQPGFQDDRTCGPPGGGVVLAQEPPAGTPIDGPFDVFVAVSVTCTPVPDLVDSPVTVAAAEGIARDWLGEGRTFGFDGDCPARDSAGAQTRLVLRTEPAAGILAPSFRIFCKVVLR